MGEGVRYHFLLVVGEQFRFWQVGDLPHGSGLNAKQVSQLAKVLKRGSEVRKKMFEELLDSVREAEQSCEARGRRRDG
jgi:hypothetical protein